MTTLAPIAWNSYTAPRYEHQSGQIDGGKLRIGHPSEEGIVTIGYELDLPAGMTVLDVMNARRDDTSDPSSKEYWRWGATSPALGGNDNGYVANRDMAHHVLGNARERVPSQDYAATLAAAGFKKKHETSIGWSRKTPSGTMTIFMDDDHVHLIHEKPRAMHWNNLARFSMRHQGHNCIVQAIWPDFMDSLGALLHIVIDAANFADATGLTAKRVRAPKAA